MKKAQVIKFLYAGVELEGLVLPDGSRMFGLSQAASLNLVPPNRSAKQLRGMTGMDFPSHQKVKSDLNSKAVNCISLEDFKALIRWADKQGNELATRIVDASVHLSLDIAFDNALGLERTTRDYQADFEAMVESKDVRRSLTDTWQEYYEITGEYPAYGKHTVFLYQIIGLYEKYLQYTKEVSKSRRAKYTFRHDYLSGDERRIITRAENRLRVYIEDFEMTVDKALEKLKSKY